MNRQQRRQSERDHSKQVTLHPRLSEKVAVAYAHASDKVTPQFHRSLFRLGILDAYGAALPDGTVIGGHGRIGNGGAHLPLQSGAVIARARNKLVQQFLDLDGIDWMWMVDDDMVYEPDLLEQLLAAAHPTDRPIMGGLCFSYTVDRSPQFSPTMYAYVPDSQRLWRLTQYPADSLVPVAGTGAACLLVHRTVLTAMRDARKPDGRLKFPPPRPWFDETPFYPLDDDGQPIQEEGDEYSEDLTFCLRAQSLGFPVHVHTGIKLGHVKQFEANEAAFMAESAVLRRSVDAKPWPASTTLSAELHDAAAPPHESEWSGAPESRRSVRSQGDRGAESGRRGRPPFIASPRLPNG